MLFRSILHAQHLLENKEAVINEGRLAGQAIIEEAKHEANRLISQTEIVQEANLRAQDILRQVDEELAKMRHQTDEYIDVKLANFEESLQKTMQVVKRGREKINGNNS